MPLPGRTFPLSDVEVTNMNSTLLTALSDMEIAFADLHKKLCVVKKSAASIQKRKWETASDPSTERPYDFNCETGEPRWECPSALLGNSLDNGAEIKFEAQDAGDPSTENPCDLNQGTGEGRCQRPSNAISNGINNKSETKETTTLKSQATTFSIATLKAQASTLAFGESGTSEEVEDDEVLTEKVVRRISGSPFDRHLESIKDKSGCIRSALVPNRFTLLVETFHFKFLTAAIIIGNCTLIGLEVDAGIKVALKSSTKFHSGAFETSSNVFAMLFTIELGLRLFAYRVHYFFGEEWRWNTFDAVLVLSAWLELSLAAMRGMSAFRVLRSLRLARALRILRVISVFRNLQLIMQGLMESFLSLFWTLVILFLVLYLVSIVLCEAISSYLIGTPNGVVTAPYGDGLSDQELRGAFAKHFRTLPRAMLSVFFSVTGGIDWYDVIQPIMHISFAYVFLYALFITFVVFGIFNALNACFVESVLSNRDKDLLIQAENHKIRMFLKDMNDLFKEADTDGDRILTRDELEEYCLNPRFCAYLSTHSLDATDAKSLFDFLDEDGSGEINVEEFALGTLKLKGPARYLDILKLQMLVSRLQTHLEGVSEAPSPQELVNPWNRKL